MRGVRQPDDAETVPATSVRTAEARPAAVRCVSSPFVSSPLGCESEAVPLRRRHRLFLIHTGRWRNLLDTQFSGEKACGAAPTRSSEAFQHPHIGRIEPTPNGEVAAIRRGLAHDFRPSSLFPEHPCASTEVHIKKSEALV